MPFELAIVYHRHGGRPLRLARVRDRSLLGAAASAAVDEAERDASDLGRHDVTLGELQMEEARKLRRVLQPLMGHEVPIM
jgi:hypothetical protein